MGKKIFPQCVELNQVMHEDLKSEMREGYHIG